MGSEQLDVIRIANREFQEFIDQASQKGARILVSRGAALRLGKLDLRLRQVSQHLASAARSSAHAPEAAYQVMKYRDNLKALRGVLETLQFSLLAERARIENLRANMQAACAWATSVRDIS